MEETLRGSGSGTEVTQVSDALIKSHGKAKFKSISLDLYSTLSYCTAMLKPLIHSIQYPSIPNQ